MRAILLLCLIIVAVVVVGAAPRRRERQTCEDRVAHLCQNELQPHYCYIEHNRRLCCRTCQAHRRHHNPDCPYGDHYTRIMRKNAEGREQTFTCSSYVQFYGRHHCDNEPQFQHFCCESCQ